ncbi:glycerophosphodiester phosphodiesterase [Microlunatus soli]|uniref:Glycerophosphoryl diester phosphodiesterase n=1 Tax=Microlunatus soli TaxID=630515 RepID=A0A1H1YWC2_9ACTN|nr:glycerophosphodiester phosphodiesterase family protein [Microlunatus soli]SDT25246.1 glycerophosphoryl diester phosphodiesterase [Microlunatus soli]
MPLVIVGHRGAPAEAPENTVASFRIADEVGAGEVETDVRVSSDGQLFMLHDADLDRVAIDPSQRGLGPVADLPWSTISSVDLGADQRVPTLQEMYAATTTPVQLEIKALAAVDGLVGYFTDHPDDAERTIISSFSIEAMAAAADRLPDVRRGVIIGSWVKAQGHPGGPLELMKQTGSTRLHCGWEGLGPEAVDVLHDAGYEVHGWPGRERDHYQRAVETGVDGTCSDDPRTFLRWVTGTTDAR